MHVIVKNTVIQLRHVYFLAVLMKSRLTLEVVLYRKKKNSCLSSEKENNAIKSQLLTKFIFFEINTTKSKIQFYLSECIHLRVYNCFYPRQSPIKAPISAVLSCGSFHFLMLSMKAEGLIGVFYLTLLLFYAPKKLKVQSSSLFNSSYCRDHRSSIKTSAFH